LIGLWAAWSRAQQAPDPPGLLYLRGNNAKRLRAVAKLCAVLADGTEDGTFFLGSIKLAEVAGMSPRTALNVLNQLVDRGVIVRTWTGGLCVRDPDGKLYADGECVPRASDYRFIGFDSVCGAK
jgi:hypothetical protein